MEKEIEEEIARLSSEMATALLEANKRIASLERELMEKPPSNHTGVEYERALELLQYLEKKGGKLPTSRAKRILGVEYNNMAVRAMKRVIELCPDDVKMIQNRSNEWMLVYERTPLQNRVNNVVHQFYLKH